MLSPELLLTFAVVFDGDFEEEIECYLLDSLKLRYPACMVQLSAPVPIAPVLESSVLLVDVKIFNL